MPGKGQKLSEEHRKIALKNLKTDYWKGKKRSAEDRLKMSLSKRGKPQWNKGKKRPEFAGEKHPNWKGGYENKLWHINHRRFMKIKNGGGHTQAEWELLKAQYNWTCPCCGLQEPKIKLSRDHIIPLSKGGSDNIENLQPLCRSCNCKKYNKIIKYI